MSYLLSISGVRRRRGRCSGFATGVLVMMLSISPGMSKEAPPASTDSWTTGSLMGLVAKSNVRRFRFSEDKFYSFLKKPAHTQGTLVYRKPDTLEKNIQTKGKIARYRIVGDELFIKKSDQKEKRVLLTHYPEVMALASSVRALIAGRIDVLKKFFDLELKGTRGNWTLTLTPTDIDLEEKIESLVITGIMGSLKKITIKETDGDKSVLTLVALKGSTE